MKLAIISHTEHYKTIDGTVVGWSPTVNEINHLLNVFDTIYHLAMLYDEEPSQSVMAYNSNQIKFIPLKPSGGSTFLNKLGVILSAPSTLIKVAKILRQVDYFQLRTPTGIGVYLIPYLTFFTKKKGWYKYAGNWNQKQPPLGYRFQRGMLKYQKRHVTINGTWPNQPEHCITFENPCLTKSDLELGNKIRQNKSIDGLLSLCYVGRIETPKGVGRIIEAISSLSPDEKKRIAVVHLVGDGVELGFFKKLSNMSGVAFKFHGYLSRTEVFEIYKQCQVFMMPTTASEGFPKVIAEAMNLGCLPIVSNISAISQYVGHKNGVILKDTTKPSILDALRYVFQLDQKGYLDLIKGRSFILENFTFDYYNSKIKCLLK